MLSIWLIVLSLFYILFFGKSELASALDDTYSFKRNWDNKTINSLVLDSAYGPHIRLNPYSPGEKRVYYYFETIDITFEVSGEGAVNPDFIVGVADGMKKL